MVVSKKTCKRIFFFVFLFFNILLLCNCSHTKNIINPIDFHQGNYLSIKKINSVVIGMNKEQIIKILGNSILSNAFESNFWIYISFRKNQFSIYEKKYVILVFDQKNILIDIKKYIEKS